MLFDTDTLSYLLAYGGTLVIALLMILGQLTAVGILLVFAGIARLAAYPVQAAVRSFTRPGRPSKWPRHWIGAISSLHLSAAGVAYPAPPSIPRRPAPHCRKPIAEAIFR